MPVFDKFNDIHNTYDQLFGLLASVIYPHCVTIPNIRIIVLQFLFQHNQGNTTMTKRIGVINWDCSLPKSTYFGHYATRSLQPEKYRDRTPYYARFDEQGQLEYPQRSLEDYEVEMNFAINAGIDYFAYCWYDQTPPTVLSQNPATAAPEPYLHELTQARNFHRMSKLKNQLAYAAILITCHPYSDGCLQDLATEMTKPYYEKIQERPVVYLFPGDWKPLLDRLNRICSANDVPKPFAVLMTNGVTSENARGIDAFSSYAFVYQATTWEAFAQELIAANAKRASFGIPVVPHFSLGWDPSPRNDHNVPWTSYPPGTYHPPAKPSQLLDAARQLKAWINQNQHKCVPNSLLAFAWNEFEEGAWICPTISNSQTAPDMTRINAFAQMADCWK